MKQRIAVFLNAIEPLFLSQKKQKNLWGIVLGGSALEGYARSLCAFPIIPLQSKTGSPITAFEEAIDHTNLSAQLKKYGITAIVVPHRSSEEIVLWAHRHSITLLGTPHATQVAFENKNTFDTLLRDYGIPVPTLITKKNIKQFSDRSVVAQESDSFGGFGTHICLGKNIPARSIASRTLLVRAYKNGVPAGVSIFLDSDENYFCSAIRRQCFTRENGKPKKFIGIQWIPTSSFSKNTLSAINDMLKKLIHLLVSEKFVGIANIDFMITQSGVSVLECNPRFSSATPHITLYPTLTHCSDPWAFLMNAFSGKKNAPIQHARLPKSSYQGALLDVDIHTRRTVNGTLPIGLYTVTNKKLVPTPSKTRTSFFLFHELPPQSRLVKDDTVCTILSDTPLFSKQGTHSPTARSILRACHDLFSISKKR